MNKDTKDVIKQLIFIAIFLGFIISFAIYYLISVDEWFEKESLADVSVCNNINEHPEEYTFRTTQQDRFDDCVKWYESGEHHKWVQTGKNMNLISKLVFISIPILVTISIFAVFRKPNNEDKNEN